MCHRLTYHCIFGAINRSTKSNHIHRYNHFSFRSHSVFRVQRNIGVVIPQWFINPIAVSGVVRGTLTSILIVYTHIFSIVITPIHKFLSIGKIADRPTPNVSAVRLSAIEIKALIPSIYDSIRNLSSLPILEILSSPHHSFTCLRSRTILNCLTESNRFIAWIIHTYLAHDNWSMCALRPEW